MTKKVFFLAMTIIALASTIIFVLSCKDDKDKIIPITAVTIVEPESKNLFVNQEIKLEAVIEPETAPDVNLIWTSSDESVVTVDKEGTVKALKSGASIIMVAASNDVKSAKNPKTASITISVYDVSIEVSPKTLTLGVGEKQTLLATVKPSSLTVLWESSNETIATVNSQTGEITAKAAGDVDIIAKAGDISDKCAVKVTNEPTIPVESVTVNKKTLTLEVGGKETLTATVKPDNATNKTVSWQSSNVTIASVNPQTGEVTAEAEGSATITATAGGKSDNCVVTVLEGFVPKIEIDPKVKNDVNAAGETFSVTITANVEFDITIDNAAISWITKSNETSSSVTIQVAQNTNYKKRDGKVTFKQKGGTAQDILTINQLGVDVILSIDPTTANISSESQDITIDVTTNLDDFDILFGSASWIRTKNKNTQTVTLSLDANPETSSRTATVTFKQKDGDKTATLEVTQAGRTPTIYYVTPNGNDNNDGKSWNTAKELISTAVYSATKGDMVWVALGSYKENVIMKEGVNIYGGFNRTESNIEERGAERTLLFDCKINSGTNYTIETKIDGFNMSIGQTVNKNVIVNNCTLIGAIVSGGVVSNSDVINDKSRAGVTVTINSNGKVLNCYISCRAVGTQSGSNYSGIEIKSGRMEGCIVKGTIYSGYGMRELISYENGGNNIINCTFHDITIEYLGTYGSCRFLSGTNGLNFVNNIVLPIHSNIGLSFPSNIYYDKNLVNLPNLNSYYLDIVTFMPNQQSDAVNGGDDSYSTLEYDINGNKRIRGTHVDIGAVESPY